MNHNLQFVSASSLSLESFADLFTRSFENYFYPMKLTASIFAARLRLESLDLHHSVVLLVNDKPVGQATLGLRGDTAWCGGFGIIPEYRGQGLSSLLFEEFIRQVREVKAKRLMLEVLIKNVTAQKVYTNAGLKRQHDLLLFEWKGDHPSPKRDSMIQVANMPEIIKHFHRLHPVSESWQRDLPTLISQSNLLQITHSEEDKLQGYILFAEKEDVARIYDVAALEVDVVRRLLKRLQNSYKEIVSVNEPENSPLTKAFLDCGFREFDRQYQMKMDL